ncbi:aminoglycoside phosphotransferase [Yinghuangia sp. ASG 101]|uniref:aminoglycoside phosphotransferase n=1 Tax=Yinghuangia sp. ASG 101 TaxID=2896848 RepID=UPI001E4130CE|nr:aminoglycoside phosphotransferase [Yinghuangia sp. ASG 101]UGQ14010.1 aminoglycoside phosphotransferase [Yinghuangia sp. ASG 101]
MSAVERVPWPALPTDARGAVERHLTGPYTVREMATYNSGVAVLLEFADGARVFVKGVPEGHDQVAQLDGEERVNGFLPLSCPRLLFRLKAAGWDFLGFSGLAGEWADFGPGSTDLPAVASMLSEVGDCDVTGLRLPSLWESYRQWCDPADEVLFQGSTLLHRDPTASNFVVSEGRAHLVDWAWPSIGPAWVDAFIWAFRLVVDGGQEPHEALRWASRVSGWKSATPAALRVFSQAEARSWAQSVEEAPGDEVVVALATAAEKWASRWA